MKGGSGALSAAAAVLILAAALGTLVSPDIEAGATRSEGEDIRIDITVNFTGITEMTGDVWIEINRINVNNTLMSADEIRSTYETEKNVTEDVDEEIKSRIDYTIGTILEGDEISTEDHDLHEDTLVNSTENLGRPIIYTLTITAETPVESILPESRLDSIEEGRMDYVIASLMLCGFTYERTVSISAEEGEVITIRLSDEIDPFGDGEITIPVGSGWPKDDDGFYTFTVDGLQSDFTKSFTFSIPSGHRISPGSEIYSGSVEVDWFALNTISITGSIDLLSVDIMERDIFSDIPDSVEAPDFVPASLIRELYLEGILDDSDLKEVSKESSARIEDEIKTALKIDTLNISSSVDTRTSGLSLPQGGSSLLGIIDSDLGLLIEVETDDPVDLDILDGYAEEDVMALLNGGLKIMRYINGIEDDEIDVSLLLPSGLYFGDETPLDSVSGRNRYELIPGTKSIRSDRAPIYDSEEIGVDALVDISGIESHYFSDAVIDMNSEMTLYINHLEFDPDDYPMKTTLNYSLDYLNADLMRLLIDMDIIDKSDLISEISDRVSSILEDFVPREEQIIDISFQNNSLIFDGDRTNVDGEDPIMADISITSDIDPFESDLLGMMRGDLENAFLPFHMDPLIPIRVVERTLNLGEAMGWDLNLSIRFPSGMGVRAWLGNGTYHYSHKLEIRTEDGYPTLFLDPESGSGDHIYIEMEFGSYFAVNNFTVCFASVWVVLLIIVLVMILSIVKRIRKKGKMKRGEENDEPDDPGDEPEEV
ncbi:MAG: hypothetical protein ACMUIG_00625 [Thermoplasmatota archaeon]